MKLSVKMCLGYFSNQILKLFESGKPIRMMLVDSEKVFDTLDLNILLNKITKT